MFSKNQFEKEYPALKTKLRGKKIVYLDNACTLLKSASAADAARALLLDCGACGGKRSVHELSRRAERSFEESRSRVASFIGARSPANIVFTRGTTDGANLVLQSFPFARGRNEVVLSPFEHNSILLPLERLAARGVIKLKIAKPSGLRVDTDALCEMLSSKTALVAVTHASNAFGGTVDAGAVCRAAHTVGAKVLVDDAQYLPTHQENAARLGADMLVFSGHKLGAQYATGALYLADEMFDFLSCSRVGGGTVKDIFFKNGLPRPVYLKSNAGFEAGVQDYSGAASLAAAMAALEKMGMENIRAQVSGLVAYAVKTISAIGGVDIIGDAKTLPQGSLLSLLPRRKDFSLADFAIYLDDTRAIAVRSGEHCAHAGMRLLGLPGTVRLSFFAYNTKDDVDAFAQALEDYLGELG